MTTETVAQNPEVAQEAAPDVRLTTENLSDQTSQAIAAAVVGAAEPAPEVSWAELTRQRKKIGIGTQPSTDVRVRLLNDCAEITIGGANPKLVSIPTLISALQAMDNPDYSAAEAPAREDSTAFFAGAMPSNVIYARVTSTQADITVYHPGRVGKLLFMDRQRKAVIPNIIISFRLEREPGTVKSRDWVLRQTGQHRMVKYLATDLPPNMLPKEFIYDVDHSKNIFLLPFTNVYDHGFLCFGQNSPPNRFKFDNLRGLDFFYSLLWEGSFNHDLGVKAARRNGDMSVDRWYQMLEIAAERNLPFPYPDLAGWRQRDNAPKSYPLLSYDMDDLRAGRVGPDLRTGQDGPMTGDVSEADEDTSDDE